MLYYTVLNFLCLIMANSVKQFCCLFRYLIYDTALIKQNCLIKLYGKPILILFFISTVQLKQRPMGLGLTSKLSMVQPWKGLTELNKILMLMRIRWKIVLVFSSFKKSLVFFYDSQGEL